MMLAIKVVVLNLQQLPQRTLKDWDMVTFVGIPMTFVQVLTKRDTLLPELLQLLPLLIHFLQQDQKEPSLFHYLQPVNSQAPQLQIVITGAMYVTQVLKRIIQPSKLLLLIKRVTQLVQTIQHKKEVLLFKHHLLPIIN